MLDNKINYLLEPNNDSFRKMFFIESQFYSELNSYFVKNGLSITDDSKWLLIRSFISTVSYGINYKERIVVIRGLRDLTNPECMLKTVRIKIPHIYNTNIVKCVEIATINYLITILYFHLKNENNC